MLSEGIVSVKDTPEWLVSEQLSRPNVCSEVGRNAPRGFLHVINAAPLHPLLDVAVYKGTSGDAGPCAC